MTYEEYKRRKNQQGKAPEALTPYQKYRAEKGLPLEPTFSTGSRTQTPSAPIVPSKQETPAPKSTLEQALEHNASLDGPPMLDLEKEPSQKDARTWFQKGAFEDGYQRGDVTKAVLGTKTDAQVNAGAGVLGLGEKAVDAVATIAPYNLAAQIQGTYDSPAQQAGALIGQMLASIFMGKDANYVQNQRNELAAQALAEAKPAAEEFIKKDLYDEKKVAQWLVDNTTIDGRINKLVGVDAERDSVLGEKSDALVQSAGQLAAQYGLSLVGVPWFVTSGVSSFGSEAESALRQGATLEEAGVSAAITAGAEILTEKLFGGDLFVKGAGFDGVVSKLTEGIANKFWKKAAQFGLDAVGEGTEEWVSQRIGQFGQWLAYRHDEKELLELLYSEESLNESIEAFLGGTILGGGMSSIKTITGNATQQPQSTPQSGADPQAENGQVTQETAAEPAPGSLEWVQELNELGAGKVAQKNAVQANSNKYHLRDYSQQQKDNWRNSKRIVLYEGVEQFKNFIKNALSGKTQTNKKLYFGAVDSDLATAISMETGVNVEGYNLALGENEIRKINKDHGSEQTEAPRGQRAVTEADYLNIPNVVQSPDSIKLSSKLYEGKPVIEFRKTNGNETTVVSAVVSDKRLDLFVQTTYVNKKKGSVATPESEQADSNTPKATGGTAPADASLDGGSHDPKAASSDVSSDASNNSISETPPVVNTDSAQPTSPESVGAAPAGFDPNSHLQYQYGTLPEGENAVRPDDLPVSTDGKNRVSQTAVTVKGAQVTSGEFSDLLTKDVTEKNGMTYIPITNDATVQKAIAHIKAEGWENAKAKWHTDVQNGKTGADMAAVGALLLNNAAKAGDKSAWLDILHDYQILGTNTAQGLQALRILKKLSPSDKLYMAKRSVKQMVEDMKLDTDVTIDPELETEYNEAETDAQRDEVLVKIQKDVARQLPTTFVEKFTALRYVNMLGNLRTQGRNIVGNLTMMGTRAIHNSIATGIETVANKVSGGKIQRTRSVTVSKEQKAAAAKDFDGLQEQILGGGKYNDNTTATGFARGVQEQKQIFKFKPLEGYRKVTNWMMEQGDIIFARDAYARALAGYLKANGITETDFSKVDTGVMDDARLFAAKEAQEATFRDTNWLSGWISKVGRRKDTPAGVKILSEGVMPFRKTPANVLVRAEEYSPLAIVNSAVMSVQKLAGNTSLVNKHGLLGKFARAGQEITGTQVINSWAKTLTGTGLFGIGMLLQGLGLLSAGPDDDDKEDAFEDLNGWQDYALTLPDGTNLTIDCFSPSAIPVLMGAQLMKLIRENGLQLKDFETALTSIADPLVEMSMLQGVNDSLENIQHADSNVGQLVINAGLSYLTQGLTNTLAGQLERSFEDSRMQTYVDKDSDLPAWLQRFLGKVSAKTPGWDYNQIPYINAWGEEEETPSTGLNLVYNLLSPSYFDNGKDDNLTRELTRLNDAQSDVNVYPSVPDKTVTINKQDYNLSADEYVSLAKLQGQTQKQLVEDLIGNSAYGVLSDEDKAQAIRYAYDYAQQSARGDVIKGHPGITTKWMKELKGDIAEGILRHITADGKYAALSVSDAAYIDDLLDGLTAEKGRSNVRPIQQIEAIADSKLSEADQKKVLEETLKESAYDKFMAVLKLGMDTDDYAASYRLYLDAEGGSGKKARIIKSFQNELDVTYSVAVKLYNIYAGKK